MRRLVVFSAAALSLVGAVIGTSAVASASTGTTATACSTGVNRVPGTASNVAAYNTASGADVHNARLPRYGRIDYFQRRLGLTGSLQFAPTDHQPRRTPLRLDERPPLADPSGCG